MYNRINLQTNDDYFKACNQRSQKNGVYFFRYIGYDNTLIEFLKKYVTCAKKNGVYVSSSPLPNPDINQVQNFTNKACKTTVYDITTVSKDISNYMPILSQEQKVLFTDSILAMLNELSQKGMNQNILHNAYIKFMVWSNTIFCNALKNIGKNEPPKILYEGDIGKYDLYMLNILSMAGCDILYFNTDNENSYIQWDKANFYSKAIYGQKKGAMSVHFSKTDTFTQPIRNVSTNTQPVQNITQNLSSLLSIKNATTTISLSTNKWLDTSGNFLTNATMLFETIEKTNTMRCLEPLSNTIYNIFAEYKGIDEKDVYNNRLYDLKETFTKQNRKFVIIENNIFNPTPNEVKNIKIIQSMTKDEIIQSFVMQLNISTNKDINKYLQKTFVNILEKQEFNSLQKLKNECNKQLCWLNRYLKPLFTSFDKNIIPCVIFFGECSKFSEALFLEMLADMPLDVICINPQNVSTSTFYENNFKKCLQILLPNTSNDISSFPNSKVRTRVATTAYSSERELDQILYNDESGLFRQHQFKTSKPVTLKTTFEEIEILWKEEAKFRPSFAIQDNDVIVPNIFAKVCGIKDDDTTRYIRYVRGLITNDTITINSFPHISTNQPNPFKPVVRGFHDKNKVMVDFIKKHHTYKFEYLADHIQDYIFSKMQELINLDWIYTNDNTNVIEAIISTILNLDTRTLQLIQQFDFTKNVPKLIVVSIDESMFSLEDCIYICFLNLVGFDTVIFTPTGYRNIEKYVNSNIFENYTIGNYKYDLTKFELKVMSEETTGNIFRKLFRK